MQISLAYSVDADDAFMFHAIQHQLVDCSGIEFSHRRGDTAWLNALASEGKTDVVAISAGAYPGVAKEYLILPHGASVGRGYGPVVIAKMPLSLSDLAGRRVAVPGLSTTAFLVLRLMQPAVVPVVVPIAPFSAVFEALDRGEVDAALLIHEGRLLYEQRGYHKVGEVGEWWQGETGLPLPLGVNVIRRGLGMETIRRVSRILSDAIAYGLAHRESIIGAIAAADRGDVALANGGMLDRYLGMYANEDTRVISEDTRAGLVALYGRAASLGLLPADISIDFSP